MTAQLIPYGVGFVALVVAGAIVGGLRQRRAAIERLRGPRPR